MAAVDTTLLPPQPTGRAAALAARHSAYHPLKLYGGWFCPFVQRAWIALEEKERAGALSSSGGYQYVEINPYRKEAEFLALNPRGLVPTLGVDVEMSGEGKGEEKTKKKRTKALYESAVLVEFIEEAYGDGGDGDNGDGALLLPPRSSAYERARCRLWMDHVATKVVPAFYRVLQHTPDKDYTIEEARENMRAQIGKFVREMLDYEEEESEEEEEDGAGGPFFLGDRFSLVDIMLAPWAKRLFLIEHYKPGGLGIPPFTAKATTGGGGGFEPRDAEDARVWERWLRWYDAVTSRPSVVDTWSDDDMYVAAYKRYADDTTNSEVGQATRKGGRLP